MLPIMWVLGHAGLMDPLNFGYLDVSIITKLKKKMWDGGVIESGKEVERSPEQVKHSMKPPLDHLMNTFKYLELIDLGEEPSTSIDGVFL